MTRLALILAVACSLYAQKPPPLVDILATEIDRNFRTLKEKGDPAPYYAAYSVTEQTTESISSTLGALQGKTSGHARFLDVTLRVGTPKLDNYHRMRGERAQFASGTMIALEDKEDAIRRRLWLETDRVYRSAVQRLIRIRTNTQVKVAEDDTSDDFSPAEPSVHFESVPKAKFNTDEWEKRLRKLSSEFSKHPSILTSSVAVMSQREEKYFVNTDGARLAHGRNFCRLAITARAKAPDGADLSTGETFEAEDPSRLPGDEVIMKAIARVAADLNGLIRAPTVDPFVGPAILSGSAAGVFFHEIFGHRVEGHRQKDEAEGQTFTKSVGTSVLPEFLSVVFDPLKRQAAGEDLNGWYEFDDEGVKAQRVAVVDKGILNTFLMSRSPVEGHPKSNGHGRRQPGAEIVSRQSNLFVESAKTVSDARLREMLIEEVKRQRKPYGLYFRQVTGGYTTTGRRGLQAFTVIPIIVYRVYPDGRPDELVRGVDIVGTPLSSFARIAATSDRPEVFNGYCGAESGTVPVSAVSPALLVTEIEVQKKDRSQERPPLLPRPAATGGGE